MLNYLNLLLLLCFANHSGTTTVSVSGQKGGNTVLICEYKAREISDISLKSRSKNIPVCPTEECSGRVFKQRNCDVVIKNLSFSDAGKYFLRVYYINDQAELERQIRTYQLHIHDEISVKIGEELKLDVLLSNADKVQHQSRRSTEWMKVWSRTDGGQSERLNIRDGNLIINPFTANDTGTYRALDSEGSVLITVTVTESKKKLDSTDKDKTDDTEQVPVIYWIMSAGLVVYASLLVSTLVALTIQKHTNS
ncbi:uncharacterized protein LOC131525806 [Onychostoma macrolepis]|uniref:uncharacterized protein LOC131525806 n=1 Tax=Onychostoma macrolepis TaxID=369639 RepID=UPI00272D5A0A|nr:uncharacterized protein LOC131525806 [Onychostoma macrolepis]